MPHIHFPLTHFFVSSPTIGSVLAEVVTKASLASNWNVPNICFHCVYLLPFNTKNIVYCMFFSQIYTAGQRPGTAGPSDIVAKNFNSWGIGANIKTILCTSDDEVLSCAHAILYHTCGFRCNFEVGPRPNFSFTSSTKQIIPHTPVFTDCHVSNYI